MARKIKLLPVHPGEILREEFLVPLELSINGLARALRVPPSHVSGIVNEKRGISGIKDAAAEWIELEVLPRAS